MKFVFQRVENFVHNEGMPVTSILFFAAMFSKDPFLHAVKTGGCVVKSKDLYRRKLSGPN